MTNNGTQPVPAAENNGSEDISFAELFEQEDHNTVINVGEVATGAVVGIDNDNVLIDVGDKAESYIPLAEFRHEDPDRCQSQQYSGKDPSGFRRWLLRARGTPTRHFRPRSRRRPGNNHR